MTFDGREAARVTRATCEQDPDHLVIMPWVHVEGTDGGWGQGFGGICLEQAHADDWRRQLCGLFGTDRLADIAGRNCFVLRAWEGWGHDIEGLEVDGRRFTLTDFRMKHWPDKTASRLESRRRQIVTSIDRAGRDVQRYVADLERVTDGYIEWSSHFGGSQRQSDK